MHKSQNEFQLAELGHSTHWQMLGLCVRHVRLTAVLVGKRKISGLRVDLVGECGQFPVGLQLLLVRARAGNGSGWTRQWTLSAYVWIESRGRLS